MLHDVPADMTTYDTARDVRDAIRGGKLPRDPRVPVSTVEVPASAACSACGRPLGPDPAFALTGDAGALLHARCFGAWLDLTVVTRGRQKDMPAA